MSKKKNRRKGFTLIEIVVVILLIGILAAIAVPSYLIAVEKSKTANPFSNLSAIAKAQRVKKLESLHYADKVDDLDISLSDEVIGAKASGKTFEGKDFTYTVYGDDEGAATATRKNVPEEDEYELSVDYATGELFCKPEEHRICKALGLGVGRNYGDPKWENCAGQVDTLWRDAFGVRDYKENNTQTCQVRVNDKKGITEFEACYNPKISVEYFYYGGSSMGTGGGSTKCIKGRFIGGNKLILQTSDNGTDFDIVNTKKILKTDDAVFYIQCGNYDYETDACSGSDGGGMYMYKAGTNRWSANCTNFDSNGVCTNFTCYNGNCNELWQHKSFAF